MSGAATNSGGCSAQTNEERGFTGHEMLDELGFIHMNGRLYDPITGRFLQADPIIQSAYDGQNYNRYSYVMNNPLSYTDPTGFSWWTKWRKTVFSVAAAIAVPWAVGELFLGAVGVGETSMFAVGATQCSAAGLTTAGNAVAAMAGGFAAGGISGGNIQSALQGAFAAALTFGVGELSNAHGPMGSAGMSTGQRAGQIAGHAAIGCASHAAAGGSCKAGAMSAGFSALAGHVPGVSDTGLLGRMAVGAIASKVGGGKAENGAMSAAFEYLFNDCMSGKCGSELEQFMYNWWPGYKIGTAGYNSFNSRSFQMSGEEAIDGALAFAGAAGKLLGSIAGPIKNWWNIGREGDALFKTLSVTEKAAYEIGMKTVGASAYASQGGRAAVEVGLAEVAEKGWIRAFLSYDSAAVGQFRNTWHTGPTAAGRLYLGNVYSTGWIGLNGTASGQR